MNIPGFNAEASLSDITGYYVAGRLGQSTGVMPAALISGGVHGRTGPCGCSWSDPDCVQCCLCIRHGGHPWQCCQ
jgi:hypothetical protein